MWRLRRGLNWMIFYTFLSCIRDLFIIPTYFHPGLPIPNHFVVVL
jgi:hypothetical protein